MPMAWWPIEYGWRMAKLWFLEIDSAFIAGTGCCPSALHTERTPARFYVTSATTLASKQPCVVLKYTVSMVNDIIIYIWKIRTFKAHANPCSFDPVQTVPTNRSSLRNQKEQNLRNGSNSSALLNHCQRQLCFGHSKASRFPDPRSTSPSWRKNTSGFIPAPFVILWRGRKPLKGTDCVVLELSFFF